MPTFIDMSALTLKSSASGQEEIQVSESNKINTSQIAALTFSQNPNMGDLPINSRLKYVDNKTTLLGMLKMLTAAANIGRLRIVSGNPAAGASGKPEMAFIVNIIQGTNAETQGTNGLQIFHLTNDYIRVIPSSSVAMAWPTLQTLTDEDVIKKLNSTASGDWGGLGMKLPWTGGSVIMISDAESISKAVTSVTWKELGQIYPVIIYDPAGVAGLPADVPSNCTLVGNVQKVDDGTISVDDGYVVTLNVFQEDNFLSGIWYQILLNSAGDVLEEKKYDLSSSGSGVKKLPGLDVGLNESSSVITYTNTELASLSAGTTLMLCFELADSDARFSPCGNVVIYYDLPPANNLWGTIAGFFDNATSFNGFINARRRGAGIIDFKCLSALVDGYPSLQVYLKHILILG